ncbi:efflux RND transporter periplasmic adaptor subunit [Nitrosomonas sp. JL21]|uniref:efflux RND transporter periplasmic adaptor subunit n=1 Tax=Nitrosomonas sp. JL21 TaxID=153949 RepID=UPI00136F3A25|nr:efflux RND transporter periplasmic adaptor subunit [Nitrosomonas sp. JL21]MXS77933.1 efflux RND transporter periplasmic adaptor subunit [Nitrosomonas sp. JL21]
MNTLAKFIVAGITVVAAISAGFWWGHKQSQTATTAISHQTNNFDKKILYYRNPMGLPDTSPIPKKDPMGMDYLPVYEGEESQTDKSLIRISTEKIQKLGVRTEEASMRQLNRTVRAVATIQVDERKLYTLVTKFEGWIHQLYVNTTGQAVKKGEILMDVYSPELITAQQEYLIAEKGLQAVANSDPDVKATMNRLAKSALQRLRNWDISEIELQRLQREGVAKEYVTLRSLANGVVLEKPSIEGKRFAPGEVLYQIADLSHVWVLADVFEQDLSMIHPGQKVTIRVDAYPEKIFTGDVTFIYPKVTSETRTAIVRIVLDNPAGLLRPDMYARVEFASFHTGNKVLTIPDSAVLDTGTRRMVLVDLGEGRYEPRIVKLGMHADGFTEVLGGIQAGEFVVVKANFLIDAESNMKAAISNFSHASHNFRTDELMTVSSSKPTASTNTVHQAGGIIKEIASSRSVIKLAHGPVPSLNWPSMTMDFSLKNPSLLSSLKPGQKVIFEFIEESPGAYVITHIYPAAGHNLGPLQEH